MAWMAPVMSMDLMSNNVWTNRLQVKDEDGFSYIKAMINKGNVAPTTVSFKKDSARMVAYVEPLKKGDKTFIVGSGYYL